MRRMTFLLITALVLALSAAPAALAQDGDKDCADFSSQAEAQTYFEANGGSPPNDTLLPAGTALLVAGLALVGVTRYRARHARRST
jgi:hypothetical protein